MTNITKLEHARHLKRAGLPLTTSLEQRTFSREYSRRWFAMLNANADSVALLIEYSQGDCSRQAWRKTERSLKKFVAAAYRFAAYSKIADEGERAVIAAFLEQKLGPVFDRWQTICASLDAGEPVEVDARALLVVEGEAA
jgi:hypothetical protein